MDTHNNEAWPSEEGVISMEIKSYKEAVDASFSQEEKDKPEKKKNILDKEKISKIFTYTNQLPLDGEKYESFSDNISLLVINFMYENEKSDSILFYGGSVKTPGTSFYGDDASGEIAKNLFTYVMNLLNE